jgi:hypothetical protein
MSSVDASALTYYTIVRVKAEKTELRYSITTDIHQEEKQLD